MDECYPIASFLAYSFLHKEINLTIVYFKTTERRVFTADEIHSSNSINLVSFPHIKGVDRFFRIGGSSNCLICVFLFLQAPYHQHAKRGESRWFHDPLAGLSLCEKNPSMVNLCPMLQMHWPSQIDIHFKRLYVWFHSLTSKSALHFVRVVPNPHA